MDDTKPGDDRRLHAVGAYLPEWMGNLFRVGLGLLFPVSVGIFAIFDVRHLVEEMLASAHLDNRAVHVNRSELHRTAYLKEQKNEIKKASQQYKDICKADAENMVERVRRGDMSFGADAVVQQASQTGVTKVLPSPSTMQLGPAPSARQPMIQAPLTGQFGPASQGGSGITQNLQYPPPEMVQLQGKQSQGWFGNVSNWLSGK